LLLDAAVDPVELGVRGKLARQFRLPGRPPSIGGAAREAVFACCGPLSGALFTAV